MEKHMFEKPYHFEGQEYTEIELDLDGLTGADMEAAQREFASKGNFTVMHTMDLAYLAILASMAAKKPREFITKLPAKEYNKITTKVQNFLLG